MCVWVVGLTLFVISPAQAFLCEEAQETSVETSEIRLPPTTIPPRDIGRQCSSQLFSPSNNNDNTQQSLIAYTPISSNTSTSGIVLRMLLYGCGVEVSDGVTVTKDCEDISEQPSCHLIGSWSPGYHGDCLYNNTGIPIGKGGYAVFILEAQWNNPTDISVRADDVGLTIFHRSRAGLLPVAMLKLGNDYVLVPPQSRESDVTSSCTATCTRSLLGGEALVTAAFSLMNSLGVKQEVSVYRGGQLAQQILNTNLATDPSARQFNFQEPIHLQPGDAINTRCIYSSINQTRTMFNNNGALADSELCFAYLRFHYPPGRQGSANPSFSSCTSWMSLLSCDKASEGGCTEEERDKFRSENLPMTRVYQEITSTCPVFGACTLECKAAVAQVTSREACMKHADSWSRVKVTVLAQSLFGRHFLSALASCELDMYEDAVAAEAARAAEEAAARQAAGASASGGKESNVSGKGEGGVKKQDPAKIASRAISRRKPVCESGGSAVQSRAAACVVTALLAVALGKKQC